MWSMKMSAWRLTKALGVYGEATRLALTLATTVAALHREAGRAGFGSPARRKERGSACHGNTGAATGAVRRRSAAVDDQFAGAVPRPRRTQ